MSYTIMTFCDACKKQLPDRGNRQRDPNDFSVSTPFCVVLAQPGSYSANYPPEDGVPVNMTDCCPKCRAVLLKAVDDALFQLCPKP